MPSLLQTLFLSLSVAALASAAPSPDDRVKIDNEHARVLVVSSPPGAKSELHEHKMNRVMIYLDPGKMTLTDADGKIEKLDFKAGDALWSPATTRPHVSFNQSKDPVRIVEIELKSTPGASAAPKPTTPDWAKADTKHYKVEFENDQVRVVRARYGPHDKAMMHEHSWNYVAAFLTDCQMKVTRPNGESKTATKSPGDVVAGTPASHVEENLAEHPLEIVIVEFKK